MRAGERVRLRLENGLGEPTAVHWHGVRVPNAMDGAAGLTQEPVEPGEAFDYDFVAPDPGTYWYHSHDRSWEQMARGLYGPLIVEEVEPWGGADRDLTLVLDDWRLTADGAIADDFGSLMDWSHAGRLGNTLTLNGRSRRDIPVRPGERVRLRLINASNARIMGVEAEGLAATLVALDGHPVPPSEVTGPVILAPAQRADLVVEAARTPGARAALLAHLDEGVVEAAILVHGDEAPLPEGGAVPPLAAWMPGDALELRDRARARLVMEGGAMGSMTASVVDGRRRSLRELAGLRRVWAFNGTAGDMIEPLMRIERGRTAVVTMRNDTRWPHAMHPARASLPGARPRRDAHAVEPLARHPSWWRGARPSRSRSAPTTPAGGSCTATCSSTRRAGMVTWVEVA